MVNMVDRFLERGDDKGSVGEFIAYLEMQGKVSCGRYLWDLLVPAPPYGQAQVDLLAIHATGLYVVESKNFAGCRLIGTESEEKWKAIYRRSRHEPKNPILQNERHIAALRAYLQYPVPMISIVAVGDACALEVPRERCSQAILCNYGRLGEAFRLLTARRTPFLEEPDIAMIYRLLYPLTATAREAAKK
jgi:hypothetical protein